jgi:tRNA modification GTPase
MIFTHRPSDPDSTIAAIATPAGEGGVAIIRVSGQDAKTIASKVFSKPMDKLRSHTVHFGHFLNDQGISIDKGLAIFMQGPKSFTGEDVVEFHCHGSSLIARLLLESLLKAGARMAEPGEFTRRAFLHGKLDLAQAEAVQMLIAAKSTLAIRAAEQQLEGRLSEQIHSFQHELTDIAAILEAWVDFPEEGLEFASFEELTGQLAKILHKMQSLASTFHQGRFLQEGFSLCLVGRPNAGKSSLLNALLGFERAIVTSIPGTTRDLLHENIRIGDLHFRLTDTAGLRQTEEVIEKEGIRRTKKAIIEADLVLFVVDGTYGLEEEDQTILSQLPLEKTIIVWNKCDLPGMAPIPNSKMTAMPISALKNLGIEELKNAIEALLKKELLPDKQEVLLTQARHYEALHQAILSIENLLEGLQKGVSPEFLSSDMRHALRELGTIIGKDVTEEILNAVFAKFCVGK